MTKPMQCPIWRQIEKPPCPVGVLLGDPIELLKQEIQQRIPLGDTWDGMIRRCYLQLSLEPEEEQVFPFEIPYFYLQLQKQIRRQLHEEVST